MNGAGGSVLFCGAWDDGPGYPRTASLREGLLRAGNTIRECGVPAFGRNKRKLLQRPWQWPATWWRLRRDGKHLQKRLQAMLRADRPRCVLVPYPGHHLVRGIKAASDVPVVLDLFLSAYDTVVEDRHLCEPGSLGALAMQRLDTRACAAADLVLLDTPENAAYAAVLTGLPPERFAWLPLSDPHASDAGLPLPSVGDELRVLFFGTGVPLHGLSTLLDAVAAVPRVHLTLVGGTAADRQQAARLLGPRLSLQPEFVDRTQLLTLLAECHLVAGVFGSSGKTQRVVPWKVVIALAAGRPVITADTPAVCRWLDGSGAVFLAPAADATSLAHLLAELAASPEQVVAAAGAARGAYDRHFGSERLAARWSALLARFAMPVAGAAS